VSSGTFSLDRNHEKQLLVNNSVHDGEEEIKCPSALLLITEKPDPQRKSSRNDFCSG